MYVGRVYFRPSAFLAEINEFINQDSLWQSGQESWKPAYEVEYYELG
jgi:hypothetical protein